jgi:fructose-specific PTS system IIB-like component
LHVHNFTRQLSLNEELTMSKKLIALCACPMGLAHTFMAAQALEEAAVEAGYEVKIETQGADA